MSVLRLSVDDLSMAYRDVGQGPPLVLVHGIAGSMRNWARVAPRLAAERRVVSYDQRGHGLSDSPGPADGYSMEVLARDLELLLDHLALDRVDLLGHSMGSMVAQTFTLIHPHRVLRLVLVGSTAGRLTPEETDGLAAAADAALRHGMGEAWRAHQRLLTARQRAAMAADPALADVARREFVATSPAGYAGFARSGLRRQDLRPRLGEIASPTLVLVGEHDDARLPTTQEIAELVPSATRVVITGAGHTPQVEAPQAFVETLEAFLDAR